ncbi:hypothetical protein IE81DRAFT_326988 [Ceraceosorus guamensis]|uniref:Uncharacterized protein n=1 Tax=Ceraceosorus guamensis TaxID=1522189 RepID=A0A316VPH5_9BASI|nr:hypothetical protein IE81DRAFT_326988 [Ceraceosorus guamensis]PWN38978.1 hypothetical protein IE81DRAFT_326988 [Ceraceosorus guamensis]
MATGVNTDAMRPARITRERRRSDAKRRKRGRGRMRWGCLTDAAKEIFRKCLAAAANELLRGSWQSNNQSSYFGLTACKHFSAICEGCAQSLAWRGVKLGSSALRSAFSRTAAAERDAHNSQPACASTIEGESHEGLVDLFLSLAALLRLPACLPLWDFALPKAKRGRSAPA